MKILPKLIGRQMYYCDHCYTAAGNSDPIKTTGTPHCTDCGKHHPLFIDCKGNNISPPPIDYIQMFYGRPKMEIGIG